MREAEVKRMRKTRVVGCVVKYMRNRKPERSEPKGRPKEYGASSRPI